MKISDIKLRAKKNMINNYFKFFVVCVLPFTTIFLLTTLIYYSSVVLKNTDFSFNVYDLTYIEYIRLILIVVSIAISFFIFCCIRLVTDGYFFLKVNNQKATIKKAFRFVSFRQCVTSSAVFMLRFFLSISWSLVFFSPCVAMTLILLYSYRNGNYGFNLNLTLFVSAVILFIIGLIFFYVTLKRYAMCSYVILKKKQKNPLKVIEESISLMEGHSINYSLCCLSFIGWILSCFAIVPIVYVLPYKALSKWHYFNALFLPESVVVTEEKPIIFYIKKQIKNGG